MCPISSLMPTTGWTVEYKRFEDLITNRNGDELSRVTGDGICEGLQWYRGLAVHMTVNDEQRCGSCVHLMQLSALAEAGHTVLTLEFEAGKTYKINEKQDSFALV